MRRVASAIPSLLALSVSLAGCVGPRTSIEEHGVEFVLLGEGSGAVALRIANPSGLAFVVRGTFGFPSPDFRPVQALVVLDNGSILPVIWRTDGDFAHNAEGDGTVYVGFGDRVVESPGVDAGSTPVFEVLNVRDMPTVTEATLLVTWIDQSLPLNLTFTFPSATVITESPGRIVGAFELKDFSGGPRVGTPAVVANAMSEVRLDRPSGQFAGYVKYYVSDTGRGAFRFESGADRYEISLDGDTTPDGTAGFIDGKYLFTSQEDITASVEYEGDGRQTKLFLVIAEIEDPILPGNLWEFLDEGIADGPQASKQAAGARGRSAFDPFVLEAANPAESGRVILQESRREGR